jgi:hypothetical protein
LTQITGPLAGADQLWVERVVPLSRQHFFALTRHDDHLRKIRMRSPVLAPVPPLHPACDDKFGYNNDINDIRVTIMAPPVSLRLSDAVAEKVRHMAAVEHRSIAEMTKVLVQEAIKLRDFPDIIFIDGLAGRQATLRNGAAVWEIIEPYLAAREDPSVLRESASTVDEAQLATALRYYDAYPDEIDALIALNRPGRNDSSQARRRSTPTGEWPRNVKHPDQFFREFISDPAVDEAMRRLAK